MTPSSKPIEDNVRRPRRPIRRVALRGLAIALPPILTVVLFLWIGNTLHYYVLGPITVAAREVLVWGLSDIPSDDEVAELIATQGESQFARQFVPLADGRYVPQSVYRRVRSNPGPAGLPRTAKSMYQRWVEIRFLQPYIAIPAFVAGFLLLMYLLGRFLAAGVGRASWNQIESNILRLPLVQNVYASAKQVTDFMFRESEVEIRRVVGVEYPTKGVWSLAFVTGEGLLGVQQDAGEPVLTILIPNSPMPVTGYTMMVRKSETVAVDLTVDQAFQFIISCGVVVAPHQLPSLMHADSTQLSKEPSATQARDHKSPRDSTSSKSH